MGCCFNKFPYPLVHEIRFLYCHFVRFSYPLIDFSRFPYPLVLFSIFPYPHKDIFTDFLKTQLILTMNLLK